MADIRSALLNESWSVGAFVDRLAKANARAAPFDDDSVAFCEALSESLLSSPLGRAFPQIVSLGYWLRPASIARMRQSLERVEDSRTMLVPRGVVVHVTPANVDTIFVFSWVLALLTGNTSVVRLSSRSSDATEHLLAVVGGVLAQKQFSSVEERTYLVKTAHDDSVSMALSVIADVRVVWGGDTTVAHFRQFPLPVRGREVAFPNRHSMAILDVDAVCRASDEEAQVLGERFFNDAYWFDQGGCSSPRLILWNSGTDLAGARARLRSAVDDAIRQHGYRAETGAVIAKMVNGFRVAAAADGVRFLPSSNEATWVELPDLGAYSRDNCGGGLFFDVVSRNLAADLAGFVGPQDQTAACFGMHPDVVAGLARMLNGRGIDRFVRMGRALEFEAVWDGADLAQEFVKRVVIDV